jgi:hypothetical protein
MYTLEGQVWDGSTTLSPVSKTAQFSNGFSDGFTSGIADWVPTSGTWSHESGTYLYTPGRSAGTSAVKYAPGGLEVPFERLDFSARLWRNGCDTCANRLIVRGAPDPLDTSRAWRHDWDNATYLQYTRAGFYSVYVRWDGVTWLIQDWTFSSAINQGSSWNTLRVIADNSQQLTLLINGVQVWSGSFGVYSRGQVGIGMYQATDGEGEGFWVEDATLRILPASGAVR